MDSMKIDEEILAAKRKILNEYTTPQKQNTPSVLKIALGVMLGMFMAWTISALLGVGLLSAISKAINDEVRASQKASFPQTTITRQTPKQQQTPAPHATIQWTEPDKASTQPPIVYRPPPPPADGLTPQQRTMKQAAEEHLKKQQEKAERQGQAYKNCQFWVKEYGSEKTELNRLYMETACKRVGEM